MTPGEALSASTEALRVRARLYAAALDSGDRMRAFQALQAAAIEYTAAHDGLLAWLRALPTPSGAGPQHLTPTGVSRTHCIK